MCMGQPPKITKQAKDNPGKLQELKDLFNREGEKFQVFPIDNSRTAVRSISVPCINGGRRGKVGVKIEPHCHQN